MRSWLLVVGVVMGSLHGCACDDTVYCERALRCDDGGIDPTVGSGKQLEAGKASRGSTESDEAFDGPLTGEIGAVGPDSEREETSPRSDVALDAGDAAPAEPPLEAGIADGGLDASTPDPTRSSDAGNPCSVGAACARAELISLSVIPGDLSPTFSPENESYFIEVGAFTERVTMIAEAPEGATLAVDGQEQGMATNWVSPPLAFGETEFHLDVLHGDMMSRRYTVAVGRREDATYLKGAVPNRPDMFGRSVAISADGNTLAVAARADSSASKGIGGSPTGAASPQSGAVYVYQRLDGEWTKDAYIKATNAAGGDAFGVTVSISADGNVLAVGAPQRDGDTSSDAGAVYVFRRAAGVWAQDAHIEPPGSDELLDGANFGDSLALSASGDVLAVGAPGENSAASGIDGDGEGTASDSGAAYVFRNGSGAWLQEAYVKASNSGGSDNFGCSLALSAEGDVMAVGANGEDSNAKGIDGNPDNFSAAGSGAVYVFGRQNGAWSQQAYVKASNTGQNDEFGGRLALSAAGDVLVVSARLESSNATDVGGNQDNDDAFHSGAVYVFDHRAGDWSQQAYVKASNAGRNDEFGNSVAISDDGKFFVVGAQGESSAASGIGGDQDNNDVALAGAAYLFGLDADGWSQRAYVKSTNTGEGDRFGWDLALSGDGSTLAIGAFGESSGDANPNNNEVEESGAVYVY